VDEWMKNGRHVEDTEEKGTKKEDTKKTRATKTRRHEEEPIEHDNTERTVTTLGKKRRREYPGMLKSLRSKTGVPIGPAARYWNDHAGKNEDGRGGQARRSNAIQDCTGHAVVDE